MRIAAEERPEIRAMTSAVGFLRVRVSLCLCAHRPINTNMNTFPNEKK